MKILLPFQDPYNRPLSHQIVSGGTEQFMKSIKDNCSVMGNPAIDKYKYIRKYKKLYG